jgi:hypothetical protein
MEDAVVKKTRPEPVENPPTSPHLGDTHNVEPTDVKAAKERARLAEGRVFDHDPALLRCDLFGDTQIEDLFKWSLKDHLVREDQA